MRYTCGSDAELVITDLLEHRRHRVKYIPVKVIQVLENNNTTDYRLIQPARLQPSAKLSDAGIEGEESRVIMQGYSRSFPGLSNAPNSAIRKTTQC